MGLVSRLRWPDDQDIAYQNGCCGEAIGEREKRAGLGFPEMETLVSKNIYL
jgi:hypothetical protein